MLLTLSAPQGHSNEVITSNNRFMPTKLPLGTFGHFLGNYPPGNWAGIQTGLDHALFMAY